MKAFVTLAAALILTGCAGLTTQKAHDMSPTQTYRMPGTDALISISGDLFSTFRDGLTETHINRRLVVRFDGQTVIDGELLHDASGQLRGVFNSATVEAECSSRRVSKNWIDVRCLILVNNERAATLTF